MDRERAAARSLVFLIWHSILKSTWLSLPASAPSFIKGREKFPRQRKSKWSQRPTTEADIPCPVRNYSVRICEYPLPPHSLLIKLPYFLNDPSTPRHFSNFPISHYLHTLNLNFLFPLIWPKCPRRHKIHVCLLNFLTESHVVLLLYLFFNLLFSTHTKNPTSHL